MIELSAGTECLIEHLGLFSNIESKSPYDNFNTVLRLVILLSVVFRGQFWVGGLKKGGERNVFWRDNSPVTSAYTSANATWPYGEVTYN